MQICEAKTKSKERGETQIRGIAAQHRDSGVKRVRHAGNRAVTVLIQSDDADVMDRR